MTPSATGILIEVCVACCATAAEALEAGADRLELNSALELDGLTPQTELVRWVLARSTVPAIAMARPRPGDFCYSPEEWSTLLADAERLLAVGATGIAFGVLTADHQVDVSRCAEMRKLAGDAELVFHKAFDEVRHPEVALDCLIETGIQRVMTSGLSATALEGAAIIGRLIQQSQGRIEILPAGRITAANGVDLIARTGCRQLHGSFGRNPDQTMGDEVRLLKSQLFARQSRTLPT